MEKSWDQKLAETRAKEEASEAKSLRQAQLQIDGMPHLVNLNEDPSLDRKVVYQIKEDIPLTCGRRAKDATHKMKLGGVGIEVNHCSFETAPESNVLLKPLSDKALPNIKINGFMLTDMKGIILKPNDRILIGPGSFFLFKNERKRLTNVVIKGKGEAPMLDTPENPILYDIAALEVE